MNRFITLFISVGIALLLPVTSVMAGWFGADFSAEVVQGGAQGQRVFGRMYVGAGRVRTEMKQGDKPLVEIIDPGKGVAWILDEERKVYHQRSVPKLDAAKALSENPCDALAGAVCQQLPDETLNGRSARKWLLRLNDRERLQWNDSQHGFPVKVVERGQVVMAMVFIGEERLNGRDVERWQAFQHNGKSVIESQQWYDPQLNISIRQVAQDGSFRELRNIMLGTQDAALFALPQGYIMQDEVAH